MPRPNYWTNPKTSKSFSGAFRKKRENGGNRLSVLDASLFSAVPTQILAEGIEDRSAASRKFQGKSRNGLCRGESSQGPRRIIARFGRKTRQLSSGRPTLRAPRQHRSCETYVESPSVAGSSLRAHDPTKNRTERWLGAVGQSKA